MKMKRVLVLLVCFCLLIPFTAQAREMNMYVNNQYLVRDVQDVGGFDMLPVLDIAGELGFTASFDGTTAVLSSPNYRYTFTLGSPDVYDKEGRWYGLDIVPQMINGKFMIPAKFFQDAMGKSYFWDSVTDSVFLDSDAEYKWLISTPEYQQAKNAPKTKAITPYEKLKNYVIENEIEIYKVGEYSCCSLIDLGRYWCIATYEASEGLIEIFGNLDDEDGSGYCTLGVQLTEGSKPVLVLLYKHDSTEFYQIMECPSAYSSYIILESTVPYALRDTADVFINSMLGLIDSELQADTGITLKDLGVYYK